MARCEVSLELVDYLKDELDEDERVRIEKHLVACEPCQRELEVIRQTFGTLHRDLVPIELSAHFRIALASRLDEATTAAVHGPQTGLRAVRPSSRLLREPNKGFATRVVEHARRSPYFALSILAHAAAILVAATVVVMLPRGTAETPPHEGIIIEKPPPHPEDINATLMAAYRDRTRVPRIESRAETVAGGIRVDLGLLMTPPQGTIVLLPDPRLRCVRGFPADHDRGPRSADLLAQYPDAVACSIRETKIDVPEAIAKDFLPAGETYVVQFIVAKTNQECLEFWSKPSWNDLEARCRRAGFATAFPTTAGETWAAILRRREAHGLTTTS